MCRSVSVSKDFNDDDDRANPSPSIEMMVPATPPDESPSGPGSVPDPVPPPTRDFTIPWQGPSDAYEAEAEAEEPGALDLGGFLTKAQAAARAEQIAGLTSDGRQWMDVLDLLGETEDEWLYATQVPGTVADTLALRKSLIGKNPPAHIRITIDALRHGIT